MAVDYTPSDWLTGIVLTDATYCKIPWTALGITWIETGGTDPQEDIRNILRGLAASIKTHYDNPAPDDTPTKFTASTSTKYNDSTLEFEERNGWTFDLSVDSTSLASEV